MVRSDDDALIRFASDYVSRTMIVTQSMCIRLFSINRYKNEILQLMLRHVGMASMPRSTVVMGKFVCSVAPSSR